MTASPACDASTVSPQEPVTPATNDNGSQALAPLTTDESASPDYLRRSSRWLAVIAGILIMQVIYTGRSLLMPITLAVVFALLLRPIVRRLWKWRIPEFVGAAIVMGAALAVIGIGTSQLIGPASEWIRRTPVELKVRQLQRKLRPVQEPLQEFNAATSKIEELAAESSAPAGGSGKIGQVEVRQPSLARTVMSTTSEFLAGAALCVVLTYFLLALGDSFLNSVVQVMPRLREKKQAVELVRNVEQGVSSYLLTVTLINTILGIVIGIAVWLIGLPNPMLWGVMATLLNFVPYAGALIGSGVVFVVGLFTFESIGEAAIAPIVYFSINAVEGNLITPAIVGRSMSLNPIVVFLSLAFWGWMWGICGALLAVPLLAITKISCERFKCTRPISVLISR